MVPHINTRATGDVAFSTGHGGTKESTETLGWAAVDTGHWGDTGAFGQTLGGFGAAADLGTPILFSWKLIILKPPGVNHKRVSLQQSSVEALSPDKAVAEGLIAGEGHFPC